MTLTKTLNGYTVIIRNVPETAERFIIATDRARLDDLTDEVNYVYSAKSKEVAYKFLIKANLKNEKIYHLYI